MELSKVSEWLVVNKLSQISIKMYDNSASGFCSLERKDFVKFLGILIDCNLACVAGAISRASAFVLVAKP